MHVCLLRQGNKAAFPGGEFFKTGQSGMPGETLQVVDEMLQVDFRHAYFIFGGIGRGLHVNPCAGLRLGLGQCFAALGGEHI